MARAKLSSRGVTLLELLVVLMILSLILTAAVKTWDVTLERGRFESTRRKLDQLAEVIVGDPDYAPAGERVDFGYVGDIGNLPQTLADLVVEPTVTPPESSRWRGPYIHATFNESPDGYRIDGWGDTIIFDRDSLFVRSLGGYGMADRSKWLTRYLGHTKDDLTANPVDGRVLDVRGVGPPDSLLYRITLELQRPLLGRTQPIYALIGSNGEFTFGFQPVSQGGHMLRTIYMHDTPPPPWAETTLKYVTVHPGMGARDLQIRLNVDWSNP